VINVTNYSFRDSEERVAVGGNFGGWEFEEIGDCFFNC
jgi:hypothetical protein